MANVLVTGGSGLIGWRACEQLLANGHTVVVYDKKPNAENLAGLSGPLTIVPGDITNLPQLLSTLREHAVDRILHLAAYITHESNSDPAGAFRINTIGSANVFDAALAMGVQRVCWASTVVAVGCEPDYPGDLRPEPVVYAPSGPYGVAKYATEVMAQGYADLLGLDVVAVRPPLAYGLGRLTGGTGVFNEAVRQVALGKPAVIRGQGPMQMIYNRDMARLFLTALFAPGSLPQRVYNTPVIGAPTPEGVAETLRWLRPGAEVSTAPWPGVDVRPGPYLDGAAASRDLAFTPAYSLADALKEMLDAYAATGD